MKLVLAYPDGDGYTYSCDVRWPIQYESAEAAAVDFENLCRGADRAARDGHDWRLAEFKFCGLEFRSTDFMKDSQYYAPDFWTIDEWFAQENQQ